MKIIRPVEINDARLTTSNVPENDHPEYSGAATYDTGDRVMVAAEHKIYECLASGTTGVNPVTDVDSEVPKWILVGSTNRWSMFDGVVGTSTESGEAFFSGTGQGVQVDLAPGKIVNSLAFFGLSGATLNVTMTDPTDGEVYNRTVNLTSTDGITNWYSYFFEPIEELPDLVLTDLPSYGNATILVSIDSPGSTASCSLAIPGTLKPVGQSQYGSSVGILDFSRKERDDFGRIQVIERDFSKRTSLDVVIDRIRVDSVVRLLSQFRAKPVVWIGSESYASTLVYGYYRDFDTVISNFSTSELSIEIEGLT